MLWNGADNKSSGIKLLMQIFGVALVCLFFSGFAWGLVVEEWVRHYDGGIKSYDSAEAIAVDGQGNIYVTGSSTGDGINYDYATIKYSPDGRELWVRRYNGPANGWNFPRGIAVDFQGNVFVTGYSFGSGVQDEYTTIKYSPDGQEIWVRRYLGPVSVGGFSTAICVDLHGNVYVSGFIRLNDILGWDYVTIKYDPDGNLLWEARYDGPGSPEDINHGDYPVAIALDGQGNVYVTGTAIGVWTGDDYATIKYSPDGQQLWVRRYNGPGNDYDLAGAMAVDSAGNVHVTGVSMRSGTGYDWLTIKYNTDGQKLWSRFFAGPAGYAGDYPKAIAVDSQGNVLVTGTSKPPGARYSEYTTIKYRGDGKKLWVRRYTLEKKGSYPAAMVLDQEGNVYITGQSWGAENGDDYTTIKYDPDGRRLWTRRYSGPGKNWDCPLAMALDSHGNVYVTGVTYLSNGNTDFCTVKYRQHGRIPAYP